MRRPACGPRGRRAARAAVACLAAAALQGPPATARPLQLEDLLQRESFGAIRLAPGGRRLLVEQRGPYAAGARFDYGDFNALFRTRLMIADLSAGGRLRPLFPPTKATGYRLGAIAPDGAHAVVYRLTASSWDLGIATLASGQVRWLSVAPEILPWDRSLAWISPSTLLVIAVAPGVLPLELRARRPQAALPALWARSARGDTAVTAVGSGAYLPDRPRAPLRRLLRVSAATGKVETLATGDWVDLEPSPDGRRLALVEAAQDIALDAGRPLQGGYGLGVRRMRLRLVDIRTRTITSPCAGCDVLTSPLSWSPDGADLLAYVRADGAPWTDGRLVRVSYGLAETLDAGIRPHVVLRPERVAAGWWGRDPLVFGTPTAGGRPDWFRLTPTGPVNLTAALKQPSANHLVATASGLLTIADGRLWRIGPDNHAVALADAPFRLIPDRPDGTLDRSPYTVAQADGVSGILGLGAEARAVRIGGDGRIVTSVPVAGPVAALGAAGALLDRTSPAGETLTWVRSGRGSLDLVRINPRLAEVDRPKPVAVRHLGPNGEALTSWIVLPAPSGARAPPLVIVPYPGASHPTAPELADPPLMDPTGILVGHGYAVLVPSLPTWRSGGGPADGLAHQVLAIVDAAAGQADLAGRFDPNRLGLWGHSFGGYGTLAMIGESDRFRAAVAAAPASDLISDWGQFGPQRRGNPDEGLTTPWSAGWVEASQADMRRPPWEDPDRYLRNSPLLMAGTVHTPVLLAYGELDGSHPGQAEEMFSALFRQDKDAVLLTYWGEQHLFASPGNLRDYYRRSLAFLDRYLRPAPPDGDRAARPARRGPALASSAPRTPPPPPGSGPCHPPAR
jgi:dipeptidyl aminopeptidase/acylaminoacyl peptidase